MSRADLLRGVGVLGIALGIVLVGVGCAPERVSFRVIDAVDDDPLTAGDSWRIALRDREDLTVAEWTYPIARASGSLDSLPTGRGLSLVVEVLAADRVVARGRSFAFDLDPGTATPHPDVYVGRLGRFASPLVMAANTRRALAIAVDASGATWIDSDGTVHRFTLHDRSGGLLGEPSLVRVAALAERADATWIGLADGHLLGVGGTLGGAVLLDASGTELASIDGSGPELARHRFGAALAYVDGSVIVSGGAVDALAAPTAAITRLDVAASPLASLAAADLGALPTPRRDATAVPIVVRGRADCPCVRLAIVGGRDASTDRSLLTVLDPAGVDPPFELDDPIVRPDAAVLEISDGILALAGGRDGLGAPVSLVDLVVVRVDGIARLIPSPPALFAARYGATALVLEPGLGLVVGGITSGGAPSTSAELIEFPGTTLATGMVTAPTGHPRATRLANGLVLLVDEGLVTLYVSPRTR